MHKQRLLRLAKRLRNVGLFEFNLGCWAVIGGVNCTMKPTCGTVACAAGHAGLLPEFRKLGFKTDVHNNNITYKQDENEPYLESGTHACAKFFDISFRDAEYIFFASRYPDEMKTKPKQVAERIEQFVSEQEKAQP